MSGTGGRAGSGGTIKASQNSKLFAYNGNMYSDDTSYDDGLNQCPIYLQNGIQVAKYTYNPAYGGESSYMLFELVLQTEQKNISKTGYVNVAYETYSNAINKRYITKNSILTNVDMSTQGIGSGAGYTEISNGTYTVDSGMN